MGVGLIFGAIDDRVKADTVPHGDIDFLFVVIAFDKIAFVIVSLLGGRDPRQQQEEDKVVKYAHIPIILRRAR
jgi:hypothetical protein